MEKHSVNTPSGAGHAAEGYPTGSPAVQFKPEWLRLPRTGQRCPYTGLSRSALNLLILASSANGFKPPVHSVVLRSRGALRGTRLISFDSLSDHLNGLAEGANKPAA